MHVKVIGRAAIDESCICRCCGHIFNTSQALTKVDAKTGELTNALLVCCPSCRSDDVLARASGGNP